LFQVADGVSRLVIMFLVNYPNGDNFANSFPYSKPFVWKVGDRALYFVPLLTGLIQLAVVLGIALLLYGRTRTDAPDGMTEPS
jgi:hypothetical protein